jgi:hypothetical protein
MVAIPAHDLKNPSQASVIANVVADQVRLSHVVPSIQQLGSWSDTYSARKLRLHMSRKALARLYHLPLFQVLAPAGYAQQSKTAASPSRPVETQFRSFLRKLACGCVACEKKHGRNGRLSRPSETADPTPALFMDVPINTVAGSHWKEYSTSAYFQGPNSASRNDSAPLFCRIPPGCSLAIPASARNNWRATIISKGVDSNTHSL